MKSILTPGYGDFEFDLPSALLERLIRFFDSIPPAPLHRDQFCDIPEAQGVYQLFLDEQLTYIGKTDAEAGLFNRLRRHENKIQHRIGLDPTRVMFKAVRIYVFTAMDLETLLINYHGGEQKVAWNGSGFGSNDPGRQRDTTEYKETHFDALYPIDINRTLENFHIISTGSAAAILAQLKAWIPYTLRYQAKAPKSKTPHADLVDTKVSLSLPSGSNSVHKILETVVRQLPPGWQATRLPSHVILYKEKREYPYGKIISQSPQATKPNELGLR